MKTKIYKVFSIMLTLAVILSTCLCAIGTVSAQSTTYYVSATGNDAAVGTEQAPLLTVDGAILKANAAGYTEGDTVYVKVLGTDGVLWKPYLTPTCLTKYTFTLDISSATSGAIVGNTNDTVTTTMVELSGPTKISNIKIANKSSNDYIGFGFYGNDVEIGDGVTFGSYFVTYQLGVWNNGVTPNSVTYNDDQNIIFKSKDTRYLNLGNNYGAATFNGDINVTVDHASANPYFYFSCNNAKATYNGNVNINFKQAAGITLKKNGGGSHAWGANAAVQIINSTAASVTSTTGELANIAAPKYIITNATGNKEIIEFTDTVGKYKVDTTATRFEIRATATDGTIYTPDENGYITLPVAGDYTLSLYKDPETVTYYISGSGSDDADGTKSAPLKTVVGAIKKASANDIIAGDTVNVIVLDDTTWFQTTEKEDTVTPSHAFKLNVKTGDAQTIVGIKTNPGMGFGGDTFIDNLKFSNFGQYNSVMFNDHNITFGSGATFNPYTIALGSSGTGGTVPGQTVVFNNSLSLSSGLRLANNNNGAKTYSEDINVVLNNRAASATFVMTMTYGHKSTYNKNINIYAKDATSVGFASSHFAGYNPTVEVQGAVQIILDKDYTTISDATKQYLDNVSPDYGVYYIHNASGVDGLLSFTEYAGEYEVDSETYIVKATDKEGNDFFAEDGILFLETAGEYTVTAEARPITTLEYFVEEGSDAENTFDTIAQAVEAAKAAGLTKIDTLKVKVTGNAQIGDLPEYKFTLVVESNDEKATLNTDGWFIANGKTVYQNIDLSGETLDLNGKEVTLKDTVGFNGLYIEASNAKAVIEAELALVEIIGEGNLNIAVNNPKSKFIVNFDTADFGDIRLNVKSANKVEFTGTPNVKGKVEIAVNKQTTVEGKAIIDAVSADKWYITNQTGLANAIEFTDTIGTYGYINGREVALVSAVKEYTPVNAKITVPAGVYDFVIKTQAASKYSDYIKNRGAGLKNSYAKLSAGEEVNVLYFGGSVTNGTGSSSNDTCWRGLISKWLVNTFPAAKVNNINVAYGGTSTMFGSYRLKEEVLSQEPDLIFIEFSINDHYDNTSGSKLYPVTKALAAKRFETIVRQIRVAYPDCDIVTVLTTEKAYINTNRAGELHEQAQGHEEISIAYDIPSIHIGRALSDHLSPNYAANNYAEWYEYVTDIVHPNDKGYEVYYNVIKEFMTNELVYGDYDGTVSVHDVPELQSNELLDGDIRYVDATADLVADSEELGGSGFVFTTSGGMRGSFAGGAKATDGNNSKFVVKFTGTELAMLSNDCKAPNFTVTVDGRAPTTVKKTGIYPEVLATGLNYGEHTVEIVPVFDGDTTFTIIGFFTRNENEATVKCTSHSFGAYVSNEDATCKADGTKTARCEKCKASKTVVDAGSKLSHKFENYVSDKNATCQNNCTETANCEYGCGETDTRDIAGTKLSHIFENYVSDNNATCQENGTETADCEYGCGETDTKEIPDSTVDHKFENYVPNGDATCQENGTETAECAYCCGETDTRVDQDSIVDHKFENYVPNGDATCQKNETETAECEFGCGETDTRDIPNSKVSHKYSDDLDVSCDYGCGFERTFGAQLIEEDGVTYYYYDGFKSTATGIVDYEGKNMYINKGRFLGASGLVTVDCKKMYIRNGYFLGASGLVTIGGKKMYIRNGYFLGASGLVTISGKKMYINKGYFTGASGLVTVSGMKMYINKGYFTGASGLVTIGGKKMYIRNGYFLGATGIVTINGKKHYINKGYFTGASGTVRVGGKTYKVVKGIVK